MRISTTIPPGASVRLATSTRAPGWIAVTWSTTSDTTCSSSIAAPGSTVALGPVRTSTRIGSSVASTASSRSADSRAGAPGRGPASMPASSISVSASCRIRRAVSISSGRPGGSGASGSARIRSTRRTLRSTRSRSRRSTSADTSASRGPSFKPPVGPPPRPFSRVAVLWRPTFAESPSVANMSSPTIGPLEWGSAGRARAAGEAHAGPQTAGPCLQGTRIDPQSTIAPALSTRVAATGGRSDGVRQTRPAQERRLLGDG